MDDRLVELLIKRRTVAADELPALEDEVWQRYGAERAVLALDMSGFSRLTAAHGILHFLSMIQRMREVTRPLVEEGGGQVVKYEADNMFAVAPDVRCMLDIAHTIQRVFGAAEAAVDEDLRIRVSCGIDCGRILLIPGVELFGSAVNFASKLGEDLAHPGEILMTARAYATLPSKSDIAAESVRFDISGLALEAFRIMP